MTRELTDPDEMKVLNEVRKEGMSGASGATKAIPYAAADCVWMDFVLESPSGARQRVYSDRPVFLPSQVVRGMYEGALKAVPPGWKLFMRLPDDQLDERAKGLMSRPVVGRSRPPGRE
jgi:hypothetical protein